MFKIYKIIPHNSMKEILRAFLSNFEGCNLANVSFQLLQRCWIFRNPQHEKSFGVQSQDLHIEPL